MTRQHDLQPQIARSWLQKARGLLWTDQCPVDGLLIHRCRSVHGFGMRYAIDVVYLSAAGEVLAVRENLRPGGISFGPGTAVDCLELPAGAIAARAIAVGDIVVLAPKPEPE